MQILVLKLLLTPILTGCATWAGRKYGHNISGLLIGLPLNAGPIALFLALQHGDAFASQSAKGIIFGTISLALYSSVYAGLSKKYNLLICISGGWAAYLLATLLLNQYEVSLAATFLLSIITLAVILKFFPRYKQTATAINAPAWDIPLRVILATLFVIGLTYVSQNLGPQLSGLLTPFPIFGTIFAASTHYLYGSDACTRLLRGVVVSMFSFTVFFVVIAGCIKPLSITETFLLASVACLAVQAAVVYADKFLKKFVNQQE